MASKRIVIIEDSRFIISVYRAKLQDEGYEIHAGADGEAGLALVNQLHPDLVVLDLGLPRMSGVEVLRQIREQAAFKLLPVLVLSGAYSSQVVDDARAAGATQVLSKAANTPNHVVQLIRSTLAA
jgi:CheY-like chemotaxis protein